MAKTIKHSLMEIYDVARQHVEYAFGLRKEKPPSYQALIQKFFEVHKPKLTPQDMIMIYFLTELNNLIVGYSLTAKVYKDTTIEDLRRWFDAKNTELPE